LFFLFPIFSMNFVPCGYVFTTLSLPLAKRIQMAKFNLFYQNSFLFLLKLFLYYSGAV